MARLFLLTTLTMLAFAANSLLNRAALTGAESGPAAFAALRLVSGALCLAALAAFKHGLPSLTGRRRVIGAGSLLLYILGFSFAYIALDAGVGALILFGTVQVTMFAGALLSNERIAAVRVVGAAVATLGLAWLVWPGSSVVPSIASAALMVAAGIGWGVYSLAGRGTSNALGETAANFVVASPLAVLVWIIVPDGLSSWGAILAITSGAITSGLGYALWYSVLPKLEATVAGLAQLTVPVIAVIGGVLFLAEPATIRLLLASSVILGGVALGILAQRKSGSSGS